MKGQRRRSIFKQRRAKKANIFRLSLLIAMTDAAGALSAELERHYYRHEINLREMPEEEFRFEFRIRNFDDLELLSRSLGIPDLITLTNRCVVKGFVALAIVLRRLAYPNRLGDLMRIIGRTKRNFLASSITPLTSSTTRIAI